MLDFIPVVWFLGAVVRMNTMINEMLFEVAVISGRLPVTRLHSRFAQGSCGLGPRPGSRLARRHCVGGGVGYYSLRILKG